MNRVVIDLSKVTDWESFHEVFALTLGFPAFYGRNMNAWIDCMTDVDDRDAGMSEVTVEPGEILTLQLEGVDSFAARCPDLYMAFVEASAFVNWRRIEQGDPPVLALSYFRSA